MDAALGQRRCSITSKALGRVDSSRPASRLSCTRTEASVDISRTPSWFESRSPYSDHYDTLVRRCSITRNACAVSSVSNNHTDASLQPSPESSQWVPLLPTPGPADEPDTPQPAEDQRDVTMRLPRIQTAPWNDHTSEEVPLLTMPVENSKCFEDIPPGIAKSTTPSVATEPDLLQRKHMLPLPPNSLFLPMYGKYHCLLYGHLFSPFRRSQSPLESQISLKSALAAPSASFSCAGVMESDTQNEKASRASGLIEATADEARYSYSP